MVYEKCLAERNLTLINIFGHPEKIPIEIPPAGTLLNFTNGNNSVDNIIMPEIAECDLQKELDNVSIKINHFYLCFKRQNILN